MGDSYHSKGKFRVFVAAIVAQIGANAKKETLAELIVHDSTGKEVASGKIGTKFGLQFRETLKFEAADAKYTATLKINDEGDGGFYVFKFEDHE